jgi:hypothetical protein
MGGGVGGGGGASGDCFLCDLEAYLLLLKHSVAQASVKDGQSLHCNGKLGLVEFFLSLKWK